ncbi:hypothetical protein PMZ80_003206 [Knufia obscura]|uniref:Uncharacterized protein n=1 Tax=Knufia obscura TaxID=1635080 RepID=A0ABR0RUJ3_9EURO|nr:hypothetical protein PMZ80_003206 [Knufia obscura]
MSSLLTPPQQRPQFFRSVSSTSQLSTGSSKSLSITRTFSHQKDKLRLYLALFPKGGSAGGGTYGSQLSCDSYHWAIVLGPKSPLRTAAGTAYHIVHSTSDFISTPFFYEETDLSQSPHQARNLLARIALAKVLDEQRVQALLRALASEIKIRKASQASTDSSNLELSGLSCLTWVKSAWETLSSDPQRSLKGYFGPDDWEDIESRVRKYVRRKRQQGRYTPSTEPGAVTWNPAEVPTWNYWENRETTD